MYEKDLSVSLLMDFYGEILTQKQREVIELYYDEDLSLSEIAETAKITRQGVRDCIKRGEVTLREMEQKLKLVSRFSSRQEVLRKISSAAAKIQEINASYRFSKEIGELAIKIQSDADSLCE
ncbi:MAG TPA: YlxM family DNA-binding protein [Ruminiclostridium sp.]|nr:YlxM family DNA-binding protein [Ruminiclostridium sp.]